MELFVYSYNQSPEANAIRLALGMGFDTEAEFDAFVEAQAQHWRDTDPLI